MQKMSFIAVMASKPCSLLNQLAIEEPDSLNGQIYEKSFRDFGIYFECIIQHNNSENISQIDSDELYILCIGYSFHHSHLANEAAARYLVHGLKGISSLDGYYQIIIIDKNKKRFFIGTDSAAIAPIYYAQQNDAVFFSNSIKNLLLQKVFQPSFNKKVIVELFRYSAVTPPDTLIKEISSLPSSYWLHYHQDNYFRIERVESEPLFTSPIDLPEYHHVLQQQIIPPIATSSSLGIMCSGGFDSSLMTSLLRSATDDPIPLFTLFYEQSDTAFANTRQLAELYQANNNDYQFKIDNPLTAIYESLWYVESEAVGTISGGVTFLL